MFLEQATYQQLQADVSDVCMYHDVGEGVDKFLLQAQFMDNTGSNSL